MTILLTLILAISKPPAAYIAAPAGHVPLAISSWCWGPGHRCGAPIAASAKQAVLKRGATVHLELAFVPNKVTVTILGHPVAAKVAGHEVSWRATRAGGLTVRAAGGPGWVIYVGKLALR